MDAFQLVLLITSLMGAALVVSWLDHKKGWRLAAWFNGEVANPFQHQSHSAQHVDAADKDLIIAQLTERVQILEKIVTEPAYELNQKLNRL